MATSTITCRPSPNTLVVAVGDVSGKGVPAALYSAFAAELVRGRTFRRRYLPDRSSPAGVLSSVNTILHQRQLEEYYCTLCYAVFDLKRRVMTLANSGLPYPIRCTGDSCAQIELPGVPLGSFPGSTYDEVSYPLHAGDVFVFCSDGVFEAMDAIGQEFTATRLLEVVGRVRDEPPARIVEAIFAAVHDLARRHAAERRHDRRRGARHRLIVSANRQRRRKLIPVCSRCRPTDVPPKVAMSLTRPFTRTCAPRVGTRPCWATTVISPVPSSTL